VAKVLLGWCPPSEQYFSHSYCSTDHPSSHMHRRACDWTSHARL